MSKLIKGLILVALFTTISAPAAEVSARVRLDAQLWTRPLGKNSRLKFRVLGNGLHLDRTLSPHGDQNTFSAKISSEPILATATFILVPAKGSEAAYLVTQIRVYDARTNRLIAECANYDAIAMESAPGVGVCSGVIGGDQFGLTLSKSAL